MQAADAEHGSAAQYPDSGLNEREFKIALKREVHLRKEGEGREEENGDAGHTPPDPCPLDGPLSLGRTPVPGTERRGGRLPGANPTRPRTRSFETTEMTVSGLGPHV